MFFRVVLAFTLIPIIEIWLIIKVGRVIGPLPTVAVLLAISLTGAWLARSQGMKVLLSIRDELAAGRMPAAPLLDGALVLAGGILLLTPGFFTDAVGLLFLFPLTRRLLKEAVRRWLERSLSKGTIVIRRY